MAVKKYTSTKEDTKGQVDELIGKLEDGIRSVFSSERYAEYLNVMSRFHRYSYRNQILILLQNPNAAGPVAGYVAWQNQFGRHVKKGEKGMKIIVPFKHRSRIKKDGISDSQEQYSEMSASRKAMGTDREEEREYITYQIKYVYDVGQTEGKPLPALALDIAGDVKDYSDFMAAVQKISPVPISFEPLKNMDGYYSIREKKIVLREGMSQVQTAAAVLHELSHATLHDLDVDHPQESAKKRGKTKQTMELEAESIAFVCASALSIDTSQNSWGYLASWSKDKELTDLQKSIGVIHDTSERFITQIQEGMQELRLQREPSCFVQETDPVMNVNTLMIPEENCVYPQIAVGKKIPGMN